MKLTIEHDVYNIAKRIKDIDRFYYIVYDTSKNSFEVHNSMQIDNSYCLTLPYSVLDERTLNYVYHTKSENIEKLLNEIENENRLKENAIKSSVLSQFDDAFTDILRR